MLIKAVSYSVTVTYTNTNALFQKPSRDVNKNYICSNQQPPSLNIQARMVYRKKMML